METNKHINEGNGYIFAYYFDEEFIGKDCFLSKDQKKNFKGGFGAVILANYKDSPVGPYQELLFIPGKFLLEGNESYVVTKAYCSSAKAMEDQVFCKKELADFKTEKIDDKTETISVTRDGKPIFRVEVQEWGFNIPMSSDMVKFPLASVVDGKVINWDYKGNGDANFAKIEAIGVRPAKFPDVALFTPLVGIHFEKFSLEYLNGVK
ncbi:MAG: hypothetical protein MJZ00_03395 [Paludibacteraceae bacterium]|nr:hypothetical protein [Paludibacteraceae bacterium]